MSGDNIGNAPILQESDLQESVMLGNKTDSIKKGDVLTVVTSKGRELVIVDSISYDRLTDTTRLLVGESQ